MTDWGEAESLTSLQENWICLKKDPKPHIDLVGINLIESRSKKKKKIVLCLKNSVSYFYQITLQKLTYLNQKYFKLRSQIWIIKKKEKKLRLRSPTKYRTIYFFLVQWSGTQVTGFNLLANLLKKKISICILSVI